MNEDSAQVLGLESREDARADACAAPLLATPTDDPGLPRRFADFATHARGARLCGAGRARPQFPRRARPADPSLSVHRAARGRARRRLSAGRPRHPAGGPRRASSPRPRPSSSPCSSARSMPAPGRCRCRCRPRSAAAIPISSSWRRSSTAPIPSCFSIPRSLPPWPRKPPRTAGVEGVDWKAFGANGAQPCALPRLQPDDVAYLQYSSGSTRFPHGVDGHPSRPAQQSRRPCHGHEDRRGRPRHLLAALLPRHGAGRLPAVDRRQPDVGRLSEDRGFRPPPARLARPDQPQPGHAR